MGTYYLVIVKMYVGGRFQEHIAKDENAIRLLNHVQWVGWENVFYASRAASPIKNENNLNLAYAQLNSN